MSLNNEAGPLVIVPKREIDLINLKNTVSLLKKKASASPLNGERVCKDCFEVKPLEKFTKSISSKDGRANICKKCTANNKKLSNIIKRYGSI